MMTIPNMFGIVDQLKNTEPVEFKNEFKSRWEEIKTITQTGIVHNKMRQKGGRC
jgi:hypothetical protein